MSLSKPDGRTKLKLFTSSIMTRENSERTLNNLITKTLLFVACPAIIAFGSWRLSDYSYRPCDQGDVVTNLSSATGIMNLPELIHSNDELPILILVYHPHCPCTASTVRNLERISSALSIHPHVVAFAYCPVGTSDSWIDSSITRQLVRMGADVLVDRGGDYCSQLGTVTSGHILVYDDGMSLVFSGGITPGRGHEGTCPASSDLFQRVNGHSGETIQWPVYGCPIIDKENPHS